MFELPRTRLQDFCERRKRLDKTRARRQLGKGSSCSVCVNALKPDLTGMAVGAPSTLAAVSVALDAPCDCARAIEIVQINMLAGDSHADDSH